MLWTIAAMSALLLLLVGSAGNVSWTQTTLYFSFIAFIVKLGLALGIYMRNPSAKVNKTFAIVFFGQALWDLGKFAMWTTTDEQIAFIWARISYSGYIISVFFLLSFVWAYMKRKNYFTTTFGKSFIYAPMILMLIALWTSNLVIADLISPDTLPYGFGIELWDYEYGPVYNYFFLWFQILPFIYAFVLFVFRYTHLQNPDKRKQMFYLVLGSSFPIMIGIPTGVILPALGISLPPHNHLLSLIMSIFIAVGIVKYKFLSVQPVGERIVPGRKLEHKLAEEYKIDYGHSYYIKHERSSEIAHKVLLTHLYKKKYGLIITAHNPSKIRHEYGIETTPIVWITDTETEHLSVDPIDIEQLHETIKQFVQKVPNSVVLIDGLDYLLAHNNFSKILHFVRQVKSMMGATDDALIVTKGSTVLELRKEKMLESEFIILPTKQKTSADETEKQRLKRKKNYLIIGHNPLSQSVISEFEKRCIKPTLVTRKEIFIHYHKDAVNIIKGDPLSRKVLEHAGIEKPDTVVLITLDNDSEIILCINKIRQLSENAKIITNIHNQNFLSIAKKAGADKVIPSSAIGGRLISLALTSPDIVRWIMDATTFSSREIELTQMKVEQGSALLGKTIEQVDTMFGEAANIIAIKNVEGLKQIPEDSYVIREGDVLILVVDISEVPEGKLTSDVISKFIRCRKK